MNLIAQNDDDAAATASSIASLALGTGTYYVAVGRFNAAANLASSLALSGGTETFLSGGVFDFGGMLASSSASSTVSTYTLGIDGGTLGSGGWSGIADAYKINWFSVNVVPEPGTLPIFSLGALAFRLIRRRHGRRGSMG
jgi:hypothetical protein